MSEFRLRNRRYPIPIIERFCIGDIIMQVGGSVKYRITGVADLGVWISKCSNRFDGGHFKNASNLDKENWIVVERAAKGRENDDD